MNLEINVKDYLSDKEIKDIVCETVRRAVVENIRNEKDIELLLSNTSYRIVWAIVEEFYRDNDLSFEKLLFDKVKEIISNLTSFSVFYEKDILHKTTSPGKIALDNAVKECEPIIKKKVHDIIADYPCEKFIDDSFADAAANLLADIIYTGAKKFKGVEQ